MYNISTSIYSYTGDIDITLAKVIDIEVDSTKTLDMLSLPNFSPPNTNNQEIFMNQPISWWLNGLNTHSYIKYTPVSDYVNWAYISGSNVFHIGIPVSNSIIPNTVITSHIDSTSKIMTNYYANKFGMSKVDIFIPYTRQI